jgi:hypothetical protein
MSSFVINPYRFAAASTFVPTDISGLVLWLDANEGVYNDAGTTLATNTQSVQEWHDQSTSGNDVTQTDATLKPAYTIASGIAGVEFDGTNDKLVGSALAVDQVDAKTAFIVAEWQSGLSFNNGGSAMTLYSTSVTGSAGVITGEIAYRTNLRTWVSSTNVGSGRELVTLAQSGSGNIHSVISMWLNGASVSRTSGTNGALVNAASTIVIGNGTNTSGFNYPFNGIVHEVIVYDSELSTADREDVEDYLTTKWSL